MTSPSISSLAPAAFSLGVFVDLHNIWATWVKKWLLPHGCIVQCTTTVCVVSTNLNSSPFSLSAGKKWKKNISYTKRMYWVMFEDSKRAKVNREKFFSIVLLILRKKGCGTSNKHSVWICLLASDVIQWHFNWISTCRSMLKNIWSRLVCWKNYTGKKDLKTFLKWIKFEWNWRKNLKTSE